MGVLSDALDDASTAEAEREQTTDARPPRSGSATDPFLMDFDTSSVKVDAATVEQMSNLAFAVAKLAGAL